MYPRLVVARLKQQNSEAVPRCLQLYVVPGTGGAEGACAVPLAVSACIKAGMMGRPCCCQGQEQVVRQFRVPAVQ